LLARIQAKES